MTKPEVVAAIMYARFKLEDEGCWSQLKEVLAQLKNDDEDVYRAGELLYEADKKWRYDEWVR